ncbi:dehydrogenase with different specificitie [Paraphaeosphaeria sporulosa]|uniref:Dehydrogenase with different specificitie n=1 Tax=Paraphaeosphaeria sporulosa TaxID=1460663 RepID=A0A177BX04_9PLEO|nr:dehydrogenase with different specificitie [Paraphaeosphaeria sporulosa]OAF99675.1 dehydrogenase with different specificitie [Paraphaeosphaeria sporulosa]
MIKEAHLSGKVAIVTGSSRGIGAGIALELAKKGASVTIVFNSSKSEAGANQVASQINRLENDSRAIVVQANLREVDAPERVVQATLEAFGPTIDILVNNAGVLFSKSLYETTADDFAAIFDVNVRAPLLMIKAVEPHLRAPGRIINLSSVGARQGFDSLAMYSASKSAIEGLTRALAAELGHVGHTVNAVAPGPVVSEMLDDVPQDIVEMQLKTTPVEHRHGTVDDIAQIVAWLSDDSARWVSGQTISASGGYTMY